MPTWRNKIGEFDSPDKVFPVRAEFNRAYDEGCCNWERRPMILSKEDLDAFEEERSRTRPSRAWSASS